MYTIVASSSRVVAVPSSSVRGREDKTDNSTVMETPTPTHAMVAPDDAGSNRDGDCGGEYEVVSIKGIRSSNK